MKWYENIENDFNCYLSEYEDGRYTIELMCMNGEVCTLRYNSFETKEEILANIKEAKDVGWIYSDCDDEEEIKAAEDLSRTLEQLHKYVEKNMK